MASLFHHASTARVVASSLERPPNPDANILQIVDALILYDTPMLDQRFQEAVARHPDPQTRQVLSELPRVVARGSRLTRRAAIEWERVTRGGIVDEDFLRRSERFLLEAFLDSAESQIRLKTFMSRHAPTREVRDIIDDAILVHRDIATAIRGALDALGVSGGEDAVGPPKEKAPYLGHEPDVGDLRSNIEAAILRMRADKKKPKMLVVSLTALRHLRDQGLFQDGQPTVMGVPVEVDMAWDAPKYSLRSFDSITLEEILKPA